MPYGFVYPLLSTSMRENKLRLYGTIKISSWVYSTNEYKLMELDSRSGKWEEKEFASNTSFEQDYHVSLLLEESDIAPFCGKAFTF